MIAKRRKAKAPVNENAAHFAKGLRAAIAAVRRLAPGVPQFAILRGVLPNSSFEGDAGPVLDEAATILAQSQRVFRRGDNIVIELRNPSSLAVLVEQREMSKEAPPLLANVMLCERRDDRSQFQPPRDFCAMLFNSESVRPRLPELRLYARRPAYDDRWKLCQPGWHPDSGVLIHGPAIEPAELVAISTAAAMSDRLPPHLRTLLRDFCWRAPADVANFVGALATGLLINHFVAHGKPLLAIDANQAGLGKTTLAKVLGILLSGEEAPLVAYASSPEELEKRVAARTRDLGAALLVIDNARERAGAEISSPFLETTLTAPTINFRVLGSHTEFSRPNDVLFALTMNGTRLGADLASRCLPIRLQLDGQPNARRFSHDVLEYARQHRPAILSELLGMIERWIAAGRPAGQASHRFGLWASTIGGILQANGLGEFLANQDEALAEFNAAADWLTQLAEVAVRRQDRFSEFVASPGQPVPGLSAQQLVELLRDPSPQPLLLGTGSDRAQATSLGRQLSTHVDQSVEIEFAGASLTATLRSQRASGNRKRYHIELSQADMPAATPPPAALPHATTAAPAPAAAAASPAVSVAIPQPASLPSPAGGGNPFDWGGGLD